MEKRNYELHKCNTYIPCAQCHPRQLQDSCEQWPCIIFFVLPLSTLPLHTFPTPLSPHRQCPLPSHHKAALFPAPNLPCDNVTVTTQLSVLGVNEGATSSLTTMQTLLVPTLISLIHRQRTHAWNQLGLEHASPSCYLFPSLHPFPFPFLFQLSALRYPVTHRPPKILSPKIQIRNKKHTT
jgi:hypothetical protein